LHILHVLLRWRTFWFNQLIMTEALNKLPFDTVKKIIELYRDKIGLNSEGLAALNVELIPEKTIDDVTFAVHTGLRKDGAFNISCGSPFYENDTREISFVENQLRRVLFPRSEKGIINPPRLVDIRV
jgi:hypothetical protein